ncbi:hypothetical protein E2542_SST18479 [Spatholobus suberectus]|nr:hypothetical protein E2542_SST18479 [Spatholobus suberectus]
MLSVLLPVALAARAAGAVVSPPNPPPPRPPPDPGLLFLMDRLTKKWKKRNGDKKQEINMRKNKVKFRRRGLSICVCTKV